MNKLVFHEKNKLAHAYILSSPNIELLESAALQIAAAALCEEERDVPCGHCRHCIKVNRGVHPDVTVIERELNDKGKKKKEISVEQIRMMSSDAYVLPNEAAGKVYILKEAELMNLNAQNAALKIFEEPPAGVVFILCAAKANMLLPTIRSRCAEIVMNGEETPDEEAILAAESFLTAVESGDPVRMLVTCTGLEKMDSAAAIAFVRAVNLRVADILCGRTDRWPLDHTRLLYIAELMEKCMTYLNSNVGVKHVLGFLAVETLKNRK